jgi:regulatory protein YycH of two-component signal transduction system YycFG
MKLETFNTILLVFLVALSLVLTAFVWTFQPNGFKSEKIGTEEPQTLDGAEKQLADLVRPSHTYINEKGNHYVFASKDEAEQTFVNGLSEWTLTNMKQGELSSIPDTSIELVYPVAISYSQLNTLFQVEGANSDTNSLGNNVFTRMYLSSNADNTTQLIFLNENAENPLGSVVTATAVNSISDVINNKENLLAAEPLAENEANVWDQIYLPQRLQIDNRVFRSETISRSVFSDIYLDDPITLGDQYIDSNRLESVKFSNNGNYGIYYSNPTSSTVRAASRAEQLQAAIHAINSHKGWTNDFRLYDVLGKGNFTFEFRMVQNGYPVFQQNKLSLLSIQMQSNHPDPGRYERTLLNLSSTGQPDGEKTLTAQEVKNWVADNNYISGDIEDVVVGYKLEEFESEIYRYKMTPYWYVEFDGRWIEVGDNATGGTS